MFPNVFHRFAEHGVVRKLKEILLEIVLCLGSELCVEIDVRFQPRGLIKFNNAMDLFED